MQTLESSETSTEKAAAFTQNMVDNKEWLLVNPAGDMWSTKDTSKLIAILQENKSIINE